MSRLQARWIGVLGEKTQEPVSCGRPGGETHHGEARIAYPLLVPLGAVARE